jgi:hypothetical protein
MATLTAASIEPDQLTEFIDLAARRKALEQEARTLKKREDTLKSHFAAVLKTIGKSRITRLGYVLAMVPGRVTVAWKDAYIDLAGADAAAELQANATPSLTLQVTPPA